MSDVGYLALHPFLVALAVLAWHIWQGVLKACQREYKWHLTSRAEERGIARRFFGKDVNPPHLAEHSDDWGCKRCGHDKYIDVSTCLPPAEARCCVRCGALNEKKMTDGPDYWFVDDRPPDPSLIESGVQKGDS